MADYDDISKEVEDIESEDHFKHRMHGRKEPRNVEGPREYRKGFAQMPKSKLRKIGRKGGKHSHGSRGSLSEENYEQELEDYAEEAGFGEGEEIENYGGSYKTGFASMPKSQVSKIGRKGGKIGGKHSHGFGPQYYSEEFLYPHPGYKETNEQDNEEEDETYVSDEERSHLVHRVPGHGKQGFASMPVEKVRKIASKGGKVSGQRRHEASESEEEEAPRHRRVHHGKQGFASMSKERVREIASKGGRISGKRRHEEASESEEEPEQYESTRKHGKQGFASMPKEQVRKIASKGGRISGQRRHEAASESEEEAPSRKRYHHHGKQGFASMPKERVREIASKGGKISGQRRHEASESESEGETHSTRHHGKQGFASMPKSKVRKIAAMGGRASHGTSY